MKKTILTFLALSFVILLNAQVSKSLQLTAGTLSTTLTANELATVTILTLSGTIDARDFLTMRNKMPSLYVIDLSETVISAYSGKLGTLGPGNSYDYPANTIPNNAFYNNSTGKVFTNLQLPKTLTAIGDYAFENCGFNYIAIPSTVTSIGKYAFYWSSLWKILINSSNITIGEYAFGNNGLSEIKINSMTPPIAANTAFNNINLQQIYLYVPIGAKIAYEQADVWYNFYNIIEEQNVDVKSVIASNIKVTIANKQITIEGSKIGETLTVISANGSIIINQKINNSRETINVSTSGIYFIRVGEQSIKVSI
ncbi:MAG: leucine-rich repeat domain-containing protein [Paludibacter sp.]